MVRPAFTVSEDFGQAQADYRAAKRRNRFRSHRPGVPPLGASGDYHYRNDSDYVWMGEYARSLDRDDAVIGGLTDRAVDNIVQEGLVPDPETGDPGLDQELKARWTEEAKDPTRCDVAGEDTFYDQTRTVCREMFSPGDIFALQTDEGPRQLVEQHRCRRPSDKRTRPQIVNGVELDSLRRRVRYWFSRDSIDPFATGVRLKDLKPYKPLTDDGFRRVLHIYERRRPTQTRGVTAYAPAFDLAPMLDDLNFVQLLKHQLHAMVLVTRNRTTQFKPNQAGATPPIGRYLDPPMDGETRKLEGVGPMSELTSLPGETVQINSANIPNPEYFPHVKLVLTLIGINLGMPLILVLMDGSETNFSGWRGAFDQAKQVFRRRQIILEHRWCRPSYLWSLRRWAQGDAALAKRAAQSSISFDYYRHKWSRPKFPYIQPEIEAKTALLRLANGLTSPQRLFSESGEDAFEVARETIAFRKQMISEAIAAAQGIEASTGVAVSWQDILPLPNPQGNSLSREDLASLGREPSVN